MGPSISVAGLALHQEQVCLGLRNPTGINGGKWEFIGGKVEAGESPSQALIREFQEELHKEILLGPLVAHAAFHNKNKQYILWGFLVLFVDPVLTFSEEHTELSWFSWEEAQKLDLVPSDRLLLDSLLKSPFQRESLHSFL